MKPQTVVIIAVVVVLVLLGCFYFNNRIVDPPLSVTWRDSYLAGKVLQVRNTTDDITLDCTVFAKNLKKGEKRSFNFSLPPRSVQELGIREMNWIFIPGEEIVEISARGYNGHITERVPQRDDAQN